MYKKCYLFSRGEVVLEQLYHFPCLYDLWEKLNFEKGNHSNKLAHTSPFSANSIQYTHPSQCWNCQPSNFFIPPGAVLNFVNIGFTEYLKTKYVSGNLLSLPVFVTVYTMWHNVATWCGHNGIIKHSRELS